MKHQICITILLFSSALNFVFGQNFSDCIVKGSLFVGVEQASTFNGSLTEYFEKELPGKFKNYNGSIQLQILIDTTGKACCMNIDNNTSTVSSKEFKDVVNKMIGWTPANQNNRPVNFSAILQLIFKDSKLSVNYVNEKQLIAKPVINSYTSNNPKIINERKTKSVWKLWNFANSMMPSNLSRNIGMDSNGVLWYCTDNGIVRIAGDDHWQIFDGMNTPALAGKNNSTWTTGLTVDKSNNVWIMSFDYVIKYDGKKWTKYDTSNSPLKLVAKICVDKGGDIWFCTFDGLIKYDGNNWTKYSVSNSKILSNNVKEVYLDKNETLWIATDKGINRVINGHWSLFTTENSNLPDNNISSIKGDKNGNIWAGVGTRDKYFLIRLDNLNNISVFPSGVIWNITVDNDESKIWLATNGKGLVAFDGRQFTQYDKTNSIIPINTVSDVLIDKNGDKWVSTFGGLVFTDTK